MKEAFQLFSHKEDYGIEGYQVAKTCNYFKRAAKFPQSKRQDPLANAHDHEPDPTTYSESKEMNFKRYWKKPNGKFAKAKKLTIIDEIKKQARKTPGPGEYLKESSKSVRKVKKNKYA